MAWAALLACLQGDAVASPPPPEQGHDDLPGTTAQAAFEPSVVAPAAGSVEERVLEALQAEQPRHALSLAEAALSTAKPRSQGRLRWLAARAAGLWAHAEGRQAEATTPISSTPAASGLGPQLRRRLHLSRLAGSDHPLAPWAELRLAEALFDEHPAQAATRAEALARRDWPGQAHARELHARALHHAGNDAKAIPRLRALLAEAPEHLAVADVAMPLADALAAHGDAASLEEALAIYRRVASRSPSNRHGAVAETRIEALLPKLPPRKRKALAHPSRADEMHRARALFNARRYLDAAELYDSLAGKAPPGSEAYCDARLQQGRSLLYEKKRKQTAELLASLPSRCQSSDVQAWAHYYAGRALFRSGDNENAVVHFEKLQKAAPEHRLADDALYFMAEAAEDMDDEATMLKRLSRLPLRYPDGDMQARARFRIAWHAVRNGRWSHALAELEGLIAAGPQEHAEGMEGRADYWRARALGALGLEEQACDAYEEIAREYPLSYYAQQALARLQELDSAAHQRMLEAMKQDGKPVTLRFAFRPEMDHPGFERTLELLRVGEVELAQAELGHMGALGETADPAMLWLVASLLHEAGAHAEASRLVRARLHSVLETFPYGKVYAMWRIAYPDAYAPLIEDIAADMNVPAPFVRAVAREESAFDPRAISSARAYGLIQLIESTAASHAKQLGLPHDRQALMTPEINLRVGSHFIRFLWDRFESNPAVVPAAYNAGHGAVGRWLRERPDQPLDVWIEDIPYSETRRYTRRVLQSYGIYEFLSKGELPALRSELPAVD